MSMLFLFLYIVNELMVPTTYGASIDFKTKKPVICTYWGNKIDYTRPETPITDPNTLPKECEVILMSGFTMSLNSEPLIKKEYLEPVLKLNRPVLLEVARENFYKGWSAILKPDGNEKDAKALTDFAKSNGIIGVVLISVTPQEPDDIRLLDGSVAKNIIPYLCQLKVNDEFIVGVSVNPYFPNESLDSCVLDYEAMNPLVDFYALNTFRTRDMCEAEIFNGLSPIISTNGMDGIDKVLKEFSNSKMTADRIYLICSVVVVDPDATEYMSHSEVCVTTNYTSKWCVPTTKDYYEKGIYFHEQNFGVQITWTELDDVDNSCGCGPFIAVLNIVAGYKGEQQIPCAKFDIKYRMP